MKPHQELCLESDRPLLEAIKTMDSLKRKLLIILKSGRFHSLLSIGDIQRYLLQNQSLEDSIDRALRPNVRVARPTDADASIRQQMLEHRMEFMPVVNERSEVERIIFWEELFDKSVARYGARLEVPVVIMAGGTGSRLRPLTNIIPKPLIPLGDKPIVELIVDRFAELGVKRFYFSVNYKAEMIQRYFEDLPDRPYSIQYVHEPEPLGTAGSLRLLEGMIHEAFFVCNCDIIVDQDLSEIYECHRHNHNELTLVAALKHIPIPYGTVDSGVNGELVALREKPELTLMVNTGMYVLQPHLLGEIPPGRVFHITELIEHIKQRGGRVGIFPVSEKSWTDIGSWKEYRDAARRHGQDLIEF